jgi:cytochrome c-type biogenesis protein CcmH/NrfG
MGWLIMAGATLIVGGGLGWFLRRDKGALQFLAAALLLALAGYSWQGHPGYAGSPKAPPGEQRLPDSAFATLREDLLGRFDSAWSWMNLADAFARRGDTREAAEVLQTAVRREPRNAKLWIGYAHALVVHGGYQMNPAAQLAFERAAALAPNHPGPRFFYALSLAEGGRIDEAERIWRDLLPTVPANSNYRPAIEAQLAIVLSRRPGAIVD